MTSLIWGMAQFFDGQERRLEPEICELSLANPLTDSSPIPRPRTPTFRWKKKKKKKTPYTPKEEPGEGRLDEILLKFYLLLLQGVGGTFQMIKPPILYTKKLLPSPLPHSFNTLNAPHFNPKFSSSPLLSMRLKQWRGKENNVQLMSVPITIVTQESTGKDQAERMGND